MLRSEHKRGVLIVSIDNPPSNALSAEVRADLISVVRAPADARAIVLQGAGSGFSSAIPLDRDTGAPDLAALCRAVETCTVPVVAALHGAALGPGAELALACHFRVARLDARLALPGIGMGLPPAAGASQRLPRLVGAQEALRMLLTGRAVTGEEGLALGLFDAVVEGDLTQAAVDLLAEQTGPHHRPRPMEDATLYQAAIAAARRQHRVSLPVKQRIIDCVEAALLLPIENGMALEGVAREDLELAPETAALRAAALAERRAAALPALVARAQPNPVDTLGLVGVGPGMATVAYLALSRGLSVIWASDDRAASARGVEWVEARQAADQSAGRLTAEDREADRARLLVGADLSALEQAGMQVHALAPDAAMLRHSLPGTPHLVLGGADGEMGLAIAPSGRASELALPSGEVPEVIATAVATLRRMGLSPLIVGPRPILGRRLVQAGARALARLISLGVSRRMVETALTDFGAQMPEADWPEPAGALREMSARDIQNRWLGALANEGMKLVDAGLALRPSDIDHLLVSGHHFPRWRGGPMHQADLRGLMVLRLDMRTWAADDPCWTPAPLMDRLISEGLRLPGLDR